MPVRVATLVQTDIVDVAESLYFLHCQHATKGSGTPRWTLCAATISKEWERRVAMRSYNRTEVLGLLRTSIGRLLAVARLLGSARVEFCLVVIFFVAIFVAVELHATQGRSYSQWFVYHTSWFMILLALLGASLLCAMYVRWPWKRHQSGSILVRVGLLITLLGVLFNSWRGVEGTIALREGESTDQLSLGGRCQIMASWKDRPQEWPYVFTFESGPVDWNGRTQLDVGGIDGMCVRVLNYYQHGQAVETWCSDERGVGGPLVRFQLKGNGEASVDYFLTDQDFGAEVLVGPIALRLQRATSDAMLADFLKPAKNDVSGQGLLTVFYEDHMQQIAVEEHVGKSINVGNSGVSVELVHYLPNAKLDRSGKFQAQSAEPRNPLVELLVHVPEETKPFRQVAFAKSPLLNLDGVYDRVCPVKFVYQHPKFAAATAIEFMQAKDGTLYGRTTAHGEWTSAGEIMTGSRLDIAGGFTLIVDEYLPHAQRQISFKPVKSDNQDGLEPATEVEVSIGGITERAWLQRNHLEFQRRTIATPDGTLLVQVGSAQVPLGFSLRLIDCYTSPEYSRSADTASVVQLVDDHSKVDVKRQITAAQPLKHRGLTFYHSASREAGHGKQASVFRVSYRPGRQLKTVGIWTIFIGIVTMLVTRRFWSIGLVMQWQLPVSY